ncbi:secreted RxLR effector protein 161-like [Salvia hispanica]|uniref:secreted RxLR effector protein 161-like n=1 Tax=Salvia hispanica TaxID=49212 RepID=UPI0020097D6C|nr:secreted RxLR effector protein 161-like [Salvia hispanica]
MANPGSVHWEALKWLLRYLKHTAKYGLCYSKCDDGVLLTSFVDSNYANDRDKRKSTTSYVFTVCRSCVSWKSQLQHIVALSTTESEYIAITEAMKEAVWLKGVLSELKFVNETPTVFSDSQSAIQLCKNPVHTDKNPADMGTKCLPVDKLLTCIRILHFDCGSNLVGYDENA